MGQWFDGYESE